MRFVLRDGELVPAHLAAPLRDKRSDVVPLPYVRSDCMDAVQSMTDGRLYDSRSALRAEYRRAGVEEVGNDRASFREQGRVHEPTGVAQDIKQACEELGL